MLYAVARESAKLVVADMNMDTALNLYDVPTPVYHASCIVWALSAFWSPAFTRRSMLASFAKAGRSRFSSRTTTSRATTSVTQLLEVRLTNALALLVAYIECINEDHANPRRLGREMGTLECPSRSQVEQLEAASRLENEPLGFLYGDRAVRFDVDLPPHAVAAIMLELAAERSVAGAAS